MPVTISLPTFHCNVCEHDFHPRSNRIPPRCPKCSSRQWNKDKSVIKSFPKKAPSASDLS